MWGAISALFKYLFGKFFLINFIYLEIEFLPGNLGKSWISLQGQK